MAGAIAVVSALLLTAATTDVKSTSAVPNFSGPWALAGAGWDFDPPPAGLTGPPANISGDARIPIADLSGGLFKPWAAAIVKQHNDLIAAGKMANDAPASCLQYGLPYVLQVRGTLRFLQTPEWIVMVYENDNMRRLIRLNRQHSANPVPSIFGESVGKFEGNTLVIDTIGIKVRDGFSSVDRFGSPHTPALHVVERYDIDHNGKLQVNFTVDDKATFNMPWHAASVYVREHDRPGEHICAENNREAKAGKVFMPQAMKAEF
jgi:hypothetical protein